ncbi:MAG TPA: hypothetical protein VLA72_06705 [Anaerolineales bacterium]|nr:hypothetical protein [Anaerolineales bacterium]
MPTCEIIDTFPSFLSVWNEAQHSTLDFQIDAWFDRYMSKWPEVLQKQLDDFTSLNEDWRVTARERIFPALPERLSAMQTAHDNLLKICGDIYDRCQQTTGFDNNLVCVIYVGLGCGAGWATEYDGKPAILFGLENIAEESWLDRAALTGLAAHELGHLVHFEWRKQADLQNEENQWWQLYTEGFAQRCESAILGQPSWHMQAESEMGWREWCEQNIGWLAAEFLRRSDQTEDMRPFFGSWFDLRGYKQTGYFLGHELIATLQKQMSLQEIAMLTNIESHLRPLLVEWSY